MPLQYRDRLRFEVPSWLSDRPLNTAGFRILYALSAIMDGIVQYALEGFQMRLPGIGSSTALDIIGKDRGIVRGFEETDESYAERLIEWLEYWRYAGNAFVLLKALQTYLPLDTTVKIVTRSGLWYVVYPDRTIEVLKTNNWDWDSISNPDRANRWADFWVIIDPPNFDKDGQWDDAMSNWFERPTEIFGNDAQVAVAKSVMDICSQWKGPHSHLDTLILSYDSSQFDHLAPPLSPGLPDGRYGEWSKNVAGSQVEARTLNARYWVLNPDEGLA